MIYQIFQRTVTDEAGNILAGASVEVRNESTGALANIYSDRAGTTPISNPTTTDANGFVQFYAFPDDYRVVATSGVFSVTWRYVNLSSSTQDYDIQYDTMKDVLSDASKFKNGQRILLNGFHSGINAPIKYKVNTSGDLTTHNGCTIIDLSNAADLTTWDTTAKTTWTTAGNGTGAILEAIYDGYINVKWGGAKGDGITDDTILFQNVETITSEILIGDSTYLTSGYTPSANTVFYGSGSFSASGISTNNPFEVKSDKTKHQILQSSGTALSGAEIGVSGFPEYKPCYDSQGFLWVPSFNAAGQSTSFVTKIDTKTDTVLLTKTVHKGAYACVHDPINNRIWVMCSGTEYNLATTLGSQIYVLDAKTGETVHIIPDTTFAADSKIGGGLYEPETQSIWAADGNNANNLIYKFNITTFALTTTVTVGTGPTGMAYAPFPSSTGSIYVACYASADVYRVNPTTATVVTSASVGSNPVDICFEPVTNSLFVSDNINGSVGVPGNHGIYKLNPSDLSTIANTTSSEFDPFGICYDENSKTVLLMCYTDGKINQYDPITASLIGTYATTAGGGCQGVIPDINNPGRIISTSNGISVVASTYISKTNEVNSPDKNNVRSYTAVAQKVQNVSSTSPLTIDASKGSIVIVAALTTDLTLNVPTNGVAGQKLKIKFTQDGTGGWFVYPSGSILRATAGTGFVQTGNTAGLSTWLELLYDGTNWEKCSPEDPYI